MRKCAAFIVLCAGGVAAVLACGKGRQVPGEPDEIALSQNVTTNRKPEDKVFSDFPNTWRQFINKSAEVLLPVSRPEGVPEWKPQFFSECVFSADAGGPVPQVTFTWNGPVAATAPRSAEGEKLRFDLGIHYEAFARNYYTTALSDQKLARFQLPANSALISDTQAVLLTGPGLFPKVMDYRLDVLRDRDTNQQFERHTLILRDLNQGLSYTLRQSRLGKDAWTEAGRFVFVTPVCPTSF
jgi:hypothetical protein